MVSTLCCDQRTLIALLWPVRYALWGVAKRPFYGAIAATSPQATTAHAAPRAAPLCGPHHKNALRRPRIRARWPNALSTKGGGGGGGEGVAHRGVPGVSDGRADPLRIVGAAATATGHRPRTEAALAAAAAAALCAGEQARAETAPGTGASARGVWHAAGPPLCAGAPWLRISRPPLWSGRCLKGVDVLFSMSVSEAEYPQRDRVAS